MRRRTFLGMSSGLGIVATGVLPGPASASARAKKPDLIVAADGSGDHTGIQAAIDAAPAGSTTPYVIGVQPGTYSGQVIVPATKPFLELRGLGRRPEHVVIADDRANGTLKPDGTPWGTSGSASVTVSGADFRAVNLTLANLFDEAAHPEITNRQAVAVLTRADRLVFDRVRFLGNQDTLYVNSTAAGVVNRVYLRDCYVEGDVDFIFGRATAVFDRCRIHSLNRGSTPNGYVTAPSTDITNPYGLLFAHCRFTSDAPAGTVFLGRPWHPSNDPNAIGQTIIRESWIGAHIPDVAWSDFGTWPWEDARFFEYRNTGPGALRSENRPQLTREQAAEYTIGAFLRGADGWRPDRC
ncbi:pectinesterase family protein [Actinoplanes utahensis]|uniref:Pectinesterase n=1 Tax=Actinoplanes utahensis TaxID=1869 RepID=A0A0A6UM14_ACTUT|nr:pectinesterase family protein [Actinoplanes utahensis]KHD76471.1 pectin esterase [Actinoplanes utahensis]GIF29730.1 pectinesterase [Actinoplanes utahensis]